MATHYLETPLSIMRSGFELASSSSGVDLPASTNDLIKTKLDGFASAIGTLQTRLDASESVSASPAIATTTKQIGGSKDLRTRFFANMPLLLSVTGFSAASALVIFRGIHHDRTIYSTFQLGALLLALSVVLFSIRYQKRQKIKKQQAEQLATLNQQSLAERQQFTLAAGDSLLAQHYILQQAFSKLPQNPVFQPLHNGLILLDRVASGIAKVTRFSNVSTDPPTLLVGSVYKDVESALASYATQKKVDIKADIPSEIAISLPNDELSQILLSLTQNAIEYSKPGQSVFVRSYRSRNKAIIVVSDQGHGIAPTVQPHLFEPFVRGSQAEDFEHQGMGLNLFIDRMIAEKYGGNLVVHSEPGATSAVLTMPLAHASTSPVTIVAPRPAHTL